MVQNQRQNDSILEQIEHEDQEEEEFTKNLVKQLTPTERKRQRENSITKGDQRLQDDSINLPVIQSVSEKVEP